MAEIDELLPEELALLERFFTAKSRAGRRGMRIVGCLCHQPDGVVKRRARDRYLPMPWEEPLLAGILLGRGSHSRRRALGDLRLYAAMRLFVNFFQPSFKLAAKARDGAKVRKRYHPPATPCQRLLADARTSQEVRRRLDELRATLDPVRLLREVRAVQQQRVEIADTPAVGDAAKPTPPTLEQFLSGLRTAWQAGEVRPTSVQKAKSKRLRRRPDPLAAVTTELRGWFEAEPWRTSRELFERLQAEYPGIYPGGQLRTLQRRLKEWRREVAHRMVFGTTLVGVGLAGAAASGQQHPVDLLLRLDDACASPTTPQVPPQQTSM